MILLNQYPIQPRYIQIKIKYITVKNHQKKLAAAITFAITPETIDFASVRESSPIIELSL